MGLLSGHQKEFADKFGQIIVRESSDFSQEESEGKVLDEYV